MPNQYEHSYQLNNTNALPHNDEAEAAVLAAATISEQVRPEVMSALEVEDFYHPSHKILFSAIKELYIRDIKTDQVSLAEYLDATGQLNMIGGRAFIIEITNNTFALANWREHVRIVRRCSILRSLISAATDITSLAFNAPPDDIESIVERAEAKLFTVTGKEVESASKPLVEFLTQAFTEIEDIAFNDGRISGVPTGFADLDKVLLGLRPGTMTVIGARPGVGKTAFALTLAANAAKAGVPVMFFSLEMSGSEIATRLLCAESNVSNEDVRSGRIPNDMWPDITAAIERLQNLDFTVDDTAGTNVVEIRTKARRALHGKPNGLVIVDYLQLISPLHRAENQNVMIGEISRALKILSKDLQVPVIALSQLSRDIDRRSDKRPVLADLRDSGSIEQDADIVLFIDRSLNAEEAARKERPPENQANIIVAKNRAGRSGVDIPLTFIPRLTKFMSMSKKEG